MKSKNLPGIYGFPAEFYKVFWGKLKTVILKALNERYNHGELPMSLRCGLIPCLPKGKKPREYI